MDLKRLFGLKRPAEPRAPAGPEGMRIYAIGDIHGRRDLLDELLHIIDADDAARGRTDTQLIFLGDLTDRGDDSRGVVTRLMNLAATGGNVRFIFGNHEELLVKAWEGDKRTTAIFDRNGGRETMLSYGMTADEYDGATLEQLAALIAEHVPAAHIEFLKSFEDWVEAGDYLFVHAGIRPGLVLAEQEVADLRWIRREFTDHEGDLGHIVVHGHTITLEIDERANRIGIDTGAFATGRLTAIGIEGESRWFLQTSAAETALS